MATPNFAVGDSRLVPNMNLLTTLDDKAQTDLAEKVLQGYEDDFTSSQEWRENAATALKLFFGVVDEKSFPWEGCSNLPSSEITVACYQFQSRAYEALISKDIVKCIPTDGSSIDAAKRSATYMNWQIQFKMKEWIADMDVGLLILSIVGSMVKKTTFDLANKRPASVLLRPGTFVAPYGVTRLNEADRKTHVYTQRIDDLRKMVAEGAFLNVTDLFTGGGNEDAQAPEIKAIADEATGTTPASSSMEERRVILEQHTYYDLNGDGIGEPVIVWVDKDSRKPLRMETRTYENPLTGQTEVIEHFTAYSLFPNPESWMGIGFGHLLRPFAEGIKAIKDQIIDSATLAALSSKTGFIQKNFGGPKGDIDVSLGFFKQLDMQNEDMGKAIYQLQFSPPPPILFQLLGYLDGKVDRLASLSESMMGELPPSDTAATTMMAIMEQGLKVFSSILQRNHRSLGEELSKIFYLNSIYLDDREYAMVQDSTSEEWMTFQSGRADFMNNIDVIPASDPTLASRAERLARAKEVYGLMMSNPLAVGNPTATYEATKDYMDALEVKNPGRFKFRELRDATLAAMQFKAQQAQQAQQGGMNGGIQAGGTEGMGAGQGNNGVPVGPQQPPPPNAQGQLGQGPVVG
jgi:hypothetical protein